MTEESRYITIPTGSPQLIAAPPRDIQKIKPRSQTLPPEQELPTDNTHLNYSKSQSFTEAKSLTEERILRMHEPIEKRPLQRSVSQDILNTGKHHKSPRPGPRPRPKSQDKSIPEIEGHYKSPRPKLKGGEEGHYMSPRSAPITEAEGHYDGISRTNYKQEPKDVIEKTSPPSVKPRPKSRPVPSPRPKSVSYELDPPITATASNQKTLQEPVNGKTIFIMRTPDYDLVYSRIRSLYAYIWK